MDFAGIFEPGTKIVLYFVVNGFGSLELSQNGGPLIASTGGPAVNLVGNIWTYTLSVDDTKTEGTLLIHITAGGGGEVFITAQIRSLKREIQTIAYAATQTQPSRPTQDAVTALDQKVTSLMSNINLELLNIRQIKNR